MYRNSQKKESSNRFWPISPEPYGLQKIHLPLLASVFKQLSDNTEIFQIGAQNQLIFHYKVSH